MRRETIELDERFGREYAGRYVFQEITWAKRSRIIQKHTRYHPMTGQVMSSDYIAIQAETIWASLKEQPENKPVSLEKLLSEENGIPIGLGELFSQVVNKLCGVTVEETRFLSEPSGEESLTRQSRTSDSAGSSAGRQTSSRSSQPKQSAHSS
ncbi:MAG: hypothetical protein ACE5KC_00375 [Candidatus Bathyarchaeia archaeon]